MKKKKNTIHIKKQKCKIISYFLLFTIMIIIRPDWEKDKKHLEFW